jgi:hypothetical protein
MPGQSVTMQDLNFKSGEITSWLNEYFNQAMEIKQYFDIVGKAGLVALGFTDTDADILISAFNDLETAKASFDASPFVKQVYGLGIR